MHSVSELKENLISWRRRKAGFKKAGTALTIIGGITTGLSFLGLIVALVVFIMSAISLGEENFDVATLTGEILVKYLFIVLPALLLALGITLLALGIAFLILQSALCNKKIENRRIALREQGVDPDNL